MAIMMAGAAIYLLKPNQSQVTLAGYGVNNIDIFAEYESWTNSPNLKAGDTLVQTLYLMANDGTGVAPNQSLVDINGDGLVDIAYHFRYNGFGASKYALLLNKGDNSFELVYKCVHASAEFGQPREYYGDCAAS